MRVLQTQGGHLHRLFLSFPFPGDLIITTAGQANSVKQLARAKATASGANNHETSRAFLSAKQECTEGEQPSTPYLKRGWKEEIFDQRLSLKNADLGITKIHHRKNYTQVSEAQLKREKATFSLFEKELSITSQPALTTWKFDFYDPEFWLKRGVSRKCGDFLTLEA